MSHKREHYSELDNCIVSIAFRFLYIGRDTVAEDLIIPHRVAPLAEKAGVSLSLISAIEAPGLANGFSLEFFFDIADALEVDPADLINASVFPDQLLKRK